MLLNFTQLILMCQLIMLVELNQVFHEFRVSTKSSYLNYKYELFAHYVCLDFSISYFLC